MKQRSYRYTCETVDARHWDRPTGDSRFSEEFKAKNDAVAEQRANKIREKLLKTFDAVKNESLIPIG